MKMTNPPVDAGKSRGQTGLVNRETLVARRVVATRSPRFRTRQWNHT